MASLAIGRARASVRMARGLALRTAVPAALRMESSEISEVLPIPTISRRAAFRPAGPCRRAVSPSAALNSPESRSCRAAAASGGEEASSEGLAGSDFAVLRSAAKMASIGVSNADASWKRSLVSMALWYRFSAADAIRLVRGSAAAEVEDSAGGEGVLFRDQPGDHAGNLIDFEEA